MTLDPGHITNAMLRALERDMAKQHASLLDSPVASTVASPMPTMSFADLAELAKKLDRERRERESKIFVFRGTLDEFKDLMLTSGMEVRPPTYLPIGTELFGLEVRQVVSWRGKPIVLIGESKMIDAVENDEIRLAKAILVAYPELI